MNQINNVVVALEGGALGWASVQYYLKRDKLYARLVLVFALLIIATAASMEL